MVTVTRLQHTAATLRIGFLILLFLWLTYSMCANAGIYTTAVQSAIAVCIGQIVPALYGFLILTGLLVRLNLHTLIGRPFRPIARHVFRMTDAEFCVFLVSQLAGYPVGVSMLRALYAQGKLTAPDAARLSLFCFGSGPAFLLSVFSMSVYGDVRPGLLIWGASSACNLLLAFLLRRKPDALPASCDPPRPTWSANALIGAAEDAAHALFRMCCLIVAFSIVTKAFAICGAEAAVVSWLSRMGLPTPIGEAFLMSTIEISRIAALPALDVCLPIGGALLSFGGLCVWMQLIVLGGEWFCKWKFLLCRILCALFTGIVCRFLAARMMVQTAVPVSRLQYRAQIPDRPFLSLLLLILSFFLLSHKKRLDK